MVQVAAAALALTSHKKATFADLFDGVEELDDGSSPEYTESEKKPWNTNEVIDEIDLQDWEVTPPNDHVGNDAEYGVIYGRYSSDNQDKSGCISRVKAMLDTAEDMNVPLYTGPVVDVALTGKKTSRGGLEEIVRLVQHPQVNYFFVHNVDRLARWNSFCPFLI